MVKTKKTKDQVPDNPSQDDEEAVKLHLQGAEEEAQSGIWQANQIVVPGISCTEK